MYDLLLRNGLIYDGSGEDPFISNVGIKEGRIASVGMCTEGAIEIRNLNGSVLAPGFVDIHGHSELRALIEPEISPKLLQGYTTELAGNCGVGAAPVHRRDYGSAARSVLGILGPGPEDWNWETYPEFMDRLEGKPMGIDLALLVPHGPLRSYVMGDSARIATAHEIDKMCEILDEAMRAGAFGLSTGLFYDPCCYADSRELERLFATVAGRDGLVSVHQRSEGDGILASLDEIIVPAERTGARLQISHLKIGGARNACLLDDVLGKISSARSRGVDVAFDQYPYSAGSTSLYSLLPPGWLGVSFEELSLLLSDKVVRRDIIKEMECPSGWDGIYSLVGWENIVLTAVSMSKNLCYIGKNMEEIARERGQNPFDSYFDLIAEEGKSLTMIDFITSDDLVDRIMVQDLQMFGTDGLYSGCPHPRTFNTSFRVLDHYVMDRKILSLSSAIRKLSTLPAHRLGLTDRGMIKPGQKADLLSFRPESLKDRSSYREPDAAGTGLDFVWKSGDLVVYRGKSQGRNLGGLLRK